ncbi:hypothetical protein Bbelb_019540 [Branchiostoma belcheri]|nr:hypothetical protein Bbelb_019540 [Branchiostoma belcheri]
MEPLETGFGNNPELLLMRVEQLEKAHQADEVRDALHQRLEEKARASGHEDLPKFAATLRHATLHAGNLMLDEMVLRDLGSDIDEKIGAKFAKVLQQGGIASKQLVPQFPVQAGLFNNPRVIQAARANAKACHKSTRITRTVSPSVHPGTAAPGSAATVVPRSGAPGESAAASVLR